MGMRFRRSVKIAPGIKVNLTKSGVGMTFGGKGAHYSVHSSGRHTRSMGLPGTGLYFQSSSGGGSHRRSSPAPRPSARSMPQAAVPVDPARVLPKPGLFAGGADKAYYKGVLAWFRNDRAAALTAFEEALGHDPATTSAHLFAGVAAGGLDQDERAARHLEAVVGAAHPIPDKLQAKYAPPNLVDLALGVKITDSISARAPFNELGAALILAEFYQHSGRLEDAIGLVQQLHQALPGDPVVRLSLCDLLFEDADYEAVVEVSAGVTNTSDIEVETLHLRGAALMALGHTTAALDAFKEAIAKTSGRDPHLLNTVRFDRALAYEQVGQRAKAKADFERVYAAEPQFPDIKEHLVALA